MRTVWTIIVWICYLIAINYYILTFNLIDPFLSKLIYLWSGFIVLIYCAAQVYKGAIDYKLRSFISLCLGGVAFNFLIMILYFQFNIKNYKWHFISFNGLSLITCIFILISGLRHKYFKD